MALVTPLTTTPAGGAGASKVSANVRFTKAVDNASPTLFIAAATGVRFQTAEIHVLQITGEGATEVSRTSLFNVAVAGLEQQAGMQEETGTTTPAEEVALTFDRMCVAVGTNSQCFNFATGTAG